MSSLNKLIHDFLVDLEVAKGRSDKTIRNYDFYLHRFSSWLEENGLTSPDKITDDIITKYRLWLNRLVDPVRKINLKKNTQNYHLIALRSFLKYLSKKDVKSLAPEKVDLAKMPGRMVEFVEGSDLDKLLEAPMNSEQEKIIQIRDRAILARTDLVDLNECNMANG